MKRIICLLLSLIALFTAVFSTASVAYAKEPIKSKTLDYYDLTDWGSEYDFDGYVYEFTLNKPTALYAEFDLDVDMDIVGHTYEKKLDGSNGIDFNIYIYNDEYDDYDWLEGDQIKLRKNYIGESYWYYSNTVLPAGDYAVEIGAIKDNIVTEAMKCKFRLFTYAGFSSSASMPKTATVKAGDEKKLSLTKLAPGNTFAGAKWSISNSKIAKISYRDRNYVIVKGVKTGKCTLTAKLKNG
ncbi:MAG: Ig-like domain-containing protein [Eubacterium sp.]|nr:Ig-like domain-containing protein [Eubacterium sp.]